MSLPTTSSLADPLEPSPAPRGPAIDARQVSKKYELHRHRTVLLKEAALLALGHAEKQVFWALRDVSFQVRAGETLGIVGANGAGKSTLLSLIAKTATPTRGEIRVAGRVSALLELGAGFHQDFTGRENIWINGTVMGLSRKLIESKMEEIIAFSELGRFIDEPVRNYSSGMMARLGFSVAAAVDPDILIVDEALSVGDQAFQEKSLARIQEFRQQGCTIIFVSHSLEVVQRLCDRALLLSQGQLLADGPAKEVCADYLGRVARHQLEAPRSPYETESVPLWKRLVAAAAVAGLIGGVVYGGTRYVFSELPEQRPAPLRNFGDK